MIGTIHFSGYPLFTMLAVLFHRIPFGSPAWRINLLSVVLAATGSFFHFVTILRWELWLAFVPDGDGAKTSFRSGGGWLLPMPWRWGHSTWAAIVGSGLLSFCPLIWMYSIQAEVRLPRHRPAGGRCVRARASARARGDARARGECAARQCACAARPPPRTETPPLSTRCSP